MRMQVKISDSTTGLSDKDIKKLTIVKYTLPGNFHELSLLFDNLADYIHAQGLVKFSHKVGRDGYFQPSADRSSGQNSTQLIGMVY